MNLVKIQEGLLEAENFFLYSPASDFLGTHQYRRDTNSFTLIEGSIERILPYDNYVIVVQKNSNPIGSVEALHFYIRENIQRYGITETAIGNDVSMPYYKIIKYNGFLQAYASLDGSIWENLGGWNVGKQSVQGFAVEKQPSSDLVFELVDYKIYRNPYITIGGLFDKECVVLYDNTNNIIDRKIADNSGTVQLFIHKNAEYTVKIYENATQTNEVYSETFHGVMGDEWTISENNIKLLYKNSQLTFSPTLLQEKTSEIIARVSNPIDNVTIGIDYSGEHIISLSIDNISFSSQINTHLPVGDTTIYIKIQRNYNAPITARLQNFGLILHY